VVVSLLLLVPAVAGLLLVTAGRGLDVATARVVAAATAGVTLALAVWVCVARPDVDRSWLPELGVRWAFGVDGIAVPLVLLTAVIGVLVAAHAWVDVPVGGTPATFLGCLLVVEAGALATFTARDAVLFFVAFELVLVPMWVLISRFGDRHDERARTDAGHRFILYTAVGSTLMLVGILTLVTSAGTADLRELAGGAGAALPADRQLLVAALLVTGLAVKVPVFPVHTWLPPAHTTAPTAGSVLLAAVLLKMGTYGLVRLPVSTVPDGFGRLAPVLAVAGVVGIVWGALVCLVERDLKRLIAYSSVAHMGFVALALAAGSETGLQAALFANIAHGVISALLFFLVGGLKQRWGSVDLEVARPALRETSPRLGFLFVLGLAASLGLPGLAGFWGEFFSVYAAWLPADDRPRGLFVTCAVVAAVGAALAGAYATRVARRVWVGDRPDPQAAAATPDTGGVELGVLAVLGVLVVVLGVVPGPLLAVTADAAALIAGGGR
jgi:NADH-quinone oxidoreductase subunit M